MKMGSKSYTVTLPTSCWTIRVPKASPQPTSPTVLRPLNILATNLYRASRKVRRRGSSYQTWFVIRPSEDSPNSFLSSMQREYCTSLVASSSGETALSCWSAPFDAVRRRPRSSDKERVLFLATALSTRKRINKLEQIPREGVSFVRHRRFKLMLDSRITKPLHAARTGKPMLGCRVLNARKPAKASTAIQRNGVAGTYRACVRAAPGPMDRQPT